MSFTNLLIKLIYIIKYMCLDKVKELMKPAIFSFGIFIIITILTGPTIQGHYPLRLCLTGAYYFLVTLFLYRNIKLKYVIFTAPILLLIISFIIWDGFYYLLYQLIVIIISYHFSRMIMYHNKLITVSLYLITLIIISYVVFPNYWQLYFINWSEINQKNSYLYKIEFLTKDNNELFFSKDRMNILLFWTSSCGTCKVKLEVLDSIANQYNNNDIKFKAVGLISKNENIRKLDSIYNSLNLKMESVYIPSHNPLIRDSLAIRGVPLLLVIDKGGNIRYHGNFSYSKIEFNNLE